jgi:G:T/U-mismatch repair DNA glycosylase
MFLHKHPYPPFIPANATKLIVGTLPPPRFSTGALKLDDVNFCYGSRDGQLWKILDTIFNLNLKYEDTQEAIDQRKEFLINRGIGICDIVESAQREKIDATDLGMSNLKLRKMIAYLKEYPKIDTLLFTGGKSKNGPEYLFRRLIKEKGLQLEMVSNEVPRIHQFSLCNSVQNEASHRIIKTVSLTAPSGSANRAVGSMDLYKQLKMNNLSFTTFDFRVMQYKPFF